MKKIGQSVTIGGVTVEKWNVSAENGGLPVVQLIAMTADELALKQRIDSTLDQLQKDMLSSQFSPYSHTVTIGDATGAAVGIDAAALQALLVAEVQKAADIAASRSAVSKLLAQL